MKTIGILGCGWLGLHFSQHLLQANYIVKGSTTSPSKLDELKALGIDPYLVDLQNPNEDQIHAFLSNIEVLIITIPPIRGEESTLYQTSFKRLIPYLTKNKVKKVMMMSSVSVYEPSETSITESSTSYSNDPTSRQIIEAEEVLWSTSELTTYILRLGGLFGPDRKPVRYIVNRNILDNPAMPINMIHLHDIIQFTTALLEGTFETNEIYNLVSPHYKDRLDYYTREAEELGLTLPPLGANDPKTHRKIEGGKVVQQTGIPYQTL
ncbi:MULTISPECIES: NAD(P)H-binding protein [unclassified Myroides]|uniref:NAD(P)H-binding protein n=1 Tax=unclassified Myroides TaxID=2642485 RepID=UPI003D2F5FF8